MKRIALKEMQEVLKKLFLKHHFTKEKAVLLARIHSESTLAGVNSHGINRVPPFINYVKNGWVDIQAEAEQVETIGNIERWDGNFGPGVINAVKCTQRAIQLAKAQGMGLVALRNTNHWMRGGTYGKMAAEAGCIAIFFTNTIANMPPWGAKENRIGNNPLIVSIPRKEGHILLDMALSQFSFGKMDSYQLKDEPLPFVGGWDEANNLTKDPKKIMISERALPIGYWKGSALSMILDMLATLLSAGNSTSRISQKEYETGISQIFLCIYPKIFNDTTLQEKLVDEIIQYTRNAETIYPDDKIYYPGEQSSKKEALNKKDGMYVDEKIWQKIIVLLQEK
ncbi:MAG: 3-dehydro-L-gulonate 2-dehydrogenase [Saprospiraceae bacterium]